MCMISITHLTHPIILDLYQFSDRDGGTAQGKDAVRGRRQGGEDSAHASSSSSVITYNTIMLFCKITMLL